MALIICKCCGKKISDTVKTCIHCGAQLSDETNCHLSSDSEEFFPFDDSDCESVSVNSDIDSATDDDNQTENKKKFVNFNTFDEKQKTLLEKEFLKTDKWAMKYRRNKEESEDYLDVFITGVFLLLIYVLCTIKFKFYSITAINPNLDKIALFLLIAAGAISGFAIIYFFVSKIIYAVSDKKYIYIWKFQKWIREEKSIEYNPPFLSVKEKAKFIQINEDNSDF